MMDLDIPERLIPVRDKIDQFVRTQQAPQASSGPTRAPPGLNSPFSTNTGV